MEGLSLSEIVERARARARETMWRTLCQELSQLPAAWLAEELARAILIEERRLFQAGGAPAPPERKEQERSSRTARTARIAALGLTDTEVEARMEAYRAWDRERLLQGGMLLNPPAQGTAMIGPEHRTAEGEALLTEAKDVLYALLFGDESAKVFLRRSKREVLTLTLPRSKAHALKGLFLASTEIASRGTWRDPDQVSNDSAAPNTLLQVELGETEQDEVGKCIVAVLRLVNLLEINEQVLYARLEEVAHSTLIQ